MFWRRRCTQGHNDTRKTPGNICPSHLPSKHSIRDEVVDSVNHCCCIDSLCFAVWKLVEEECLCLAVPRLLRSSAGVDIDRAWAGASIWAVVAVVPWEQPVPWPRDGGGTRKVVAGAERCVLCLCFVWIWGDTCRRGERASCPRYSVGDAVRPTS